MKISVELTFSPLQYDYEKPIQHFIKKQRASGLIIKENPLSTQIYGDYTQVMSLLTTEIEEALDLVEHGLMYVKIVKSDRHVYVPFC